jgi:hypothetical protein
MPSSLFTIWALNAKLHGFILGSECYLPCLLELLLESFQTKESLCYVMEYLEGGTLHSLFRFKRLN